MRRSIDSEYIRKKRCSRRPRDNWRRVRLKRVETKTMSDQMLLTGVTVLALGWALSTAWWVWSVL